MPCRSYMTLSEVLSSVETAFEDLGEASLSKEMDTNTDAIAFVRERTRKV